MKRKPVCFVLGFYTEAAMAEESYREIHGTGVGRACLVKPDGTIVGASSACKRYAALRLETESLLAVETEAASVDAVAGRLRLQGGPAIFILREFAPVAPPNLVCEPLVGERLREFMPDLARQHGKPGRPVDRQQDRQQLLARL